MMMNRSRRFCVAAISLTLAWWLLHPYVAGILCVRGDEFFRNGQPQEAQRYYARAVAVNADYEPAVDRLALATLQSRGAANLSAAYAAAERYVERHPAATPIQIDRALLLYALHDGRAVAAFGELWRLLGDRRFLRLAQIAGGRQREKTHS